MADDRHIENRFMAISQRLIVRFMRNLVQRSTFVYRSRDKLPNFENSRWRTATLKMFVSQYLSRESSDFYDVWCTDTNVDSKNCHVTKYRNFCKFKMADGRHIENRSYISTIYCPINAKFWHEEAESHSDTGHIAKIADRVFVRE